VIKLEKPTQEAGSVFSACITRVRIEELKTRLANVTQVVVDAANEYDTAAEHTRLHEIAPEIMVGGTVTRAEMEAVYTQRMAKIGAPGRPIYDAIFTSAPQGKCPLCGQRVVTTLDHHLPKAQYPALVVTPLNLVPSCSDCNKAKLAFLPTDSSEEMLHPYYDNIEEDNWLAAEVVHVQPPVVRFFVNAPAHWGSVLKARVEKHFHILGLGKLYSLEAADELLNIRHQLRDLHATGGSNLIRTEMRRRAESCERARRNGWRTALYHALADSHWFCTSGIFF
jgi:hypothetical protein